MLAVLTDLHLQFCVQLSHVPGSRAVSRRVLLCSANKTAAAHGPLTRDGADVGWLQVLAAGYIATETMSRGT